MEVQPAKAKSPQNRKQTPRKRACSPVDDTHPANPHDHTEKGRQVPEFTIKRPLEGEASSAWSLEFSGVG